MVCVFVLQIRKCDQDTCCYCVMCPPRLPTEKRKWLPDPVLSPDMSYKPFNEVYGTETTDEDRPMLKLQPVPSQNDKANKVTLVGGSYYIN